MEALKEKRKVKYQISKRKFCEVEVENDNEKQTVVILNRMFYRQEDKDKRYRKKTISYEWLEEIGFSFIGNQLEDFISKNDLRNIVNEAVRKLTKNQKIVIEYLYYKNYSLEETAILLNTSIQNVNQIKNRALNFLRKLLIDNYD